MEDQISEVEDTTQQLVRDRNLQRKHIDTLWSQVEDLKYKLPQYYYTDWLERGHRGEQHGNLHREDFI